MMRSMHYPNPIVHFSTNIPAKMTTTNTAACSQFPGMSNKNECPICGKRANTSSHARYCIPKNLHCECGKPATNFRKWRQGICQRCTEIELENDRKSLEIKGETTDEMTPYRVIIPGRKTTQ